MAEHDRLAAHVFTAHPFVGAFERLEAPLALTSFAWSGLEK